MSNACKLSRKKKKIKKLTLVVNLPSVFNYLQKKNKKAFQEIFNILYSYQKQMEESGFKVKTNKPHSINLPDGTVIEI